MSDQVKKHLNELIDEASRLYPLHNDLATRAYLDRIIDLALMAKAESAAAEDSKRTTTSAAEDSKRTTTSAAEDSKRTTTSAAEVPRTRTQEEYFKEHYSLCDGLFSIRRGNSEESVVEHVWVGERRFTCETVVTDKVDGKNHECEFTIRDNGRICCSGHYYGGKAIAEKVVHAAMKAYVRNLSGGGKYSNRGGFLKQAVMRAKAKEAIG